MVFYGRLSRDCAPCRRRKLRCNLDPAGCIQCRKVQLICHGYREPNELVFRNDTYYTNQKAPAREASNPLAAVLQLTWEDMSRDVFLSLYIGRYSNGFDTLGPLLARSSANGHLHASVNAVGLAFMTFQMNRPDLALLANRQYVTAIQSLRTAISSVQQSASRGALLLASDETLQSVLLLDLYEKMALRHYHQGPNFPNSCPSHIQGALHMIRARPSTDFSNPSTRQLAIRTVLALTISCGSTGKPIPETLEALRNDLDGYVRNAKWTFTSLMMRIINLRAGMRNGTWTSADILSRARDLDNQLAAAESKIPHSWRPRRIYANDPMILGDYYDIHSSHYITQVLNAFRIMRLDMNDIIQKLEPCSAVAQTVAEITLDICAAAPQFILPGARTENEWPFSPMQILQCCAILTPLYVAGQITSDGVMRNWILEFLAYTANNGVKMARDVARILMETPEVDYWAVFELLGSCAMIA